MGRGPHTVPLRALLRHAGVGLPRGRDPRGSRSSRIPPPPRVAVPFEGGRPLGSGGAEGCSCGSLAGGGAGGGGAGGAAPPLPRPVGRRPAFCCPRRAPPGHTCAVGVAGRPRASGAVRSAADGSVRRGRGGGDPPPWFAPPYSPGRPLIRPLRLRRPGRRGSAFGRQQAGRVGACLGRGAPAPGCSGLFGGGLGPPYLRSVSVRSWA